MTVDFYDPMEAPDAAAWLETDEEERIALVQEYHAAERVKLPNAMLHAALHTVIETQVAMGDELNVARVLQRLMREGLDRHDAIHAIANVFVELFANTMSGGGPVEQPNEKYQAALEKLTAKSWRKSG